MFLVCSWRLLLRPLGFSQSHLTFPTHWKVKIAMWSRWWSKQEETPKQRVLKLETGGCRKSIMALQENQGFQCSVLISSCMQCWLTTRTRSVYFMEAPYRNQCVGVPRAPPLKLLNMLVKNLWRHAKIWTYTKYHVMIEMVLLVERKWKPLKLQFHAMGSCNDRYAKN